MAERSNHSPEDNFDHAACLGVDLCVWIAEDSWQQELLTFVGAFVLDDYLIETVFGYRR